MNKNNFYIITNEKYFKDVCSLSEHMSKYVSSNNIIVNISPRDSSPLSNMLAHKLSWLNNNDVIEEINLQIPSPIQKQVWDETEEKYVPFEHHLNLFTLRNIFKNTSYLCVTSHICPDNEKYISRIMNVLNAKIPDVRMFTPYLHENTAFLPDEYLQKYKNILIYEWQNSNNPVYTSYSSQDRGNVEK